MGRLLAGRYRLESVVGRGGMGTVWRARDETLEREVAVKEVVLPAGLSDGERGNRHRRTLREARASARLNHPGVVTVHDVVEEDDRPWIVMELVRGRSLQDVVEQDGPLPPVRAAQIGAQIAGALNAAHAIGIEHRDVKPANVLVADGDRALLTDFGIAQIAGDATLTGTGLLIGSPAYMPPERVNGDPAVPASDLWSLGATLYAATEGKAPHHRADAMAVLAAVITQDPPPPRNAGPLTPVLAGLLDRDPARRMSGDRAEEALQAIAAGRAPEPDTRPAAPAPMQAPPHPSPQSGHPAPPPAYEYPPGTGGQAAYPPTRSGDPAGSPPHGQAAGYPSGTGWQPSQQPPPPGHGPNAGYPPGTGGAWVPGQGPAVTSETRGRRSPVAALAAGAVVAAAILVAAGFLLWPDGPSDDAAAQTSPQPTSIAGPSAPGGEGPPGSGDAGETPTAPSTASSDDRSGASLPDGLVQAGGPGYTIGVPRGWRRSVQGNSVIWTDPASSSYIQVDRTGWSGDPYEHWLTWERQAIADGNLKDFRRLSLTRTDVGGVPAADIEFTWTRDDGLTRARDRGLVDGGRSYAVIVALPASRWNGNEALVKNVLDTFRPTRAG